MYPKITIANYFSLNLPAILSQMYRRVELVSSLFPDFTVILYENKILYLVYSYFSGLVLVKNQVWIC
jgi:hypothetical protein